VGLAIRIWAIVTLGQAFRTTVEVDRGQAVISTGPYARIRHPSYAGLLLILVEEAELTRVLGDTYRRYQQHTKRLIPGLW
jgi:protein-S-isoprenylcysteine O-methyltransferase Ste14